MSVITGSKLKYHAGNTAVSRLQGRRSNYGQPVAHCYAKGNANIITERGGAAGTVVASSSVRLSLSLVVHCFSFCLR